MNNHPSTKVRRRANTNYRCGFANRDEPRQARRERLASVEGYSATAANRHGKNHPLLGLFFGMQAGYIR